jgi:hypothetical protein
MSHCSPSEKCRLGSVRVRQRKLEHSAIAVSAATSNTRTTRRLSLERIV